MRTFVIVPAYNEAEVIGKVIQGILREGWENVVVVDDGSTDSTARIAHHAGAFVISHSKNCGKGAGVATGVRLAIKLHADACVTFDGDGQHNPRDIKKLVALLDRYPIVLGERKEHHLPFRARLFNVVATYLTAVLCGVYLRDSQCGMRAYGKRALTTMPFRGIKYDYESEILREIRQLRLAYAVVPVHVRYTSYSTQKKHRQSLLRGVRTALYLVVQTLTPWVFSEKQKEIEIMRRNALRRVQLPQQSTRKHL